MKARGLVLDPRRYRTSVEPPATLEDTSRFGNDGVHTDITWVRLPSGLWVRSFNGSSSYVDCGMDASLDIRNAITLESWINSPDPTAGNYATILSKGATDIWRQRFYGTSGRMQAIFTIEGVVREPAASGALSADTWYHIVSTFDGTNIRIYISGVIRLTSANYPGKIDSVVRQVEIGIATETGYPFDGFIALSRIYNYALSAAQIYAHYQATRSLFGG